MAFVYFFCLHGAKVLVSLRSAKKEINKKPTLWPRGDKKSKQKPCCVFTNFSNFFYLYEEDFGEHNKQNGISGIVMGEHTRTILSFSETHPPTRFARRGQALRAWPRGREAAPRGLRIKAES